MSDLPIASVASALESALGTVRKVQALPTAGRTRVWRVVGVRAEAFLKQHASGRGYAQEQAALERWAARLAPDAPRLLAADDGQRTLLLTAVAGRPASEERPAPTDSHRAAGGWLARLHALEVGEVDAMGLEEAVARRFDAALADAPSGLGEHRAQLEAARASAGSFAGLPRVPCHRDFTPDNWQWDGARVGVVDFEHARADCRLVDFVKLAATDWAARPDLEAAFFEGYGTALDDADRERLRALVLLHGLVTWTWGERHGHAELAAAGRRIVCG